jgi:hypothetical protein
VKLRESEVQGGYFKTGGSSGGSCEVSPKMNIERAISVMNIVKNCLHNRMGDQWMNDCLITYIEKDIFKTISNEEIMQRFHGMKTRRGQLN